jgi:hypothetical protein
MARACLEIEKLIVETRKLVGEMVGRAIEMVGRATEIVGRSTEIMSHATEIRSHTADLTGPVGTSLRRRRIAPLRASRSHLIVTGRTARATDLTALAVDPTSKSVIHGWWCSGLRLAIALRA